MNDELFVYGTLHPERVPAEIADTVRRLRRVGSGWVRGRVMDLGEFPGLAGGEEKVPGVVFEVPGGAWEALDAYEGYVEAEPEASLFVRRVTAVTMVDETVRECWVYWYQGRRDHRVSGVERS